MLTTVNGIDVADLAVSAVPETATLKLPGAIVAEVVKVMVAPLAGTLIGKMDAVVNPAGSVPRVIVGVAVVPYTTAVTVTEKETLGDTETGAGLATSNKDGVGMEVDEELPPSPPPHPTKAFAARKSPRQIAADGTKLCRAYITVSDVSRLLPPYQEIWEIGVIKGLLCSIGAGSICGAPTVGLRTVRSSV